VREEVLGKEGSLRRIITLRRNEMIAELAAQIVDGWL